MQTALGWKKPEKSKGFNMSAENSPENSVTAALANYQVFMTRKDLGRFFGVSTRTIRNWQHDGTLPRPIKKIGRELRWTKSAVLELALSDRFDLPLDS